MKFFILFILSVWASAITAQVVSFEIDENKINKNVAHVLDSILEEDQLQRSILFQLFEQSACKSRTDSVINIIKQKDLSNIQVIEDIIAEYGWLGPQDVGINASQGLFLVIQHASLDIQKKYYQIIKEAEKNGKILSSNVAILEDRIAMREGRRQTYGSQGFTDKKTGKKYIYSIENPDELDIRRKSMGMPPMNTYYSDWDLEAYKKELPEIERIYKEQFQ
jgi:hypothetical protein